MLQASEIFIQVPDTHEGKKAKETFAVSLYSEGVLSQSQAAKLIDLTLHEFHELLIQRNISLEGNRAEELTEIFLNILENND